MIKMTLLLAERCRDNLRQSSGQVCKLSVTVYRKIQRSRYCSISVEVLTPARLRDLLFITSIFVSFCVQD